MAISKALIACFLLSALLVQFVQALPTPTSAPGGVGSIDCDAKCLVRCSKTKRPNLCQRACGSCCKKCNCVPPGTFGNYDACPCYAALTTRGGRPKCP